MPSINKDDPRAPNLDKEEKDKPIYTPNQKPHQPGFDDNSDSDTRHPHQEGSVPSG